MEQLAIDPNALFALILYEGVVMPLLVIKAGVILIDTLCASITTTNRIPIDRTTTPGSMGMEPSCASRTRRITIKTGCISN